MPALEAGALGCKGSNPFLATKYGDCNSMVRNIGCGPVDEGSNPSNPPKIQKG